MDYDKIFNTSGKFPTTAKFWQASSDSFTVGETITSGFSKVLGEQVYKPLGYYDTPFYNKFAGRPLKTGSQWMERALYNNTARHFKPKATAEDAFNFSDNEGMEAYFNVDVAGWVKASIPSELETIEGVIKSDGVGVLNSMLVDNVINTYQYAIESEIGKKLVSCISKEDEIDFTDGQQAVKDINKLAIRMRGNTYHYNELTNAQNEKLITRSNHIYCFIDAEILESMRESFATLPSPDRISENVEFVPIPDGCPTPITSAEYNAGTGEDAGGTTITWSSEPVAMGKDKPVAMLVADTKCEYRPLVNSYKINLGRNPAGDFDNEHLLFKGAIAVRPWDNAIRLNQSS